MSADRSDLSLAEMIARLRQFGSKDQDAILDQLDTRLRARILTLLVNDRDQGAGQGTDGGLSDWLAEKVRTGHGMTLNAHEALLACDREMASSSMFHQSAPPGPSLLARMASSLRRPGSPL